jgi:hypothetical protein
MQKSEKMNMTFFDPHPVITVAEADFLRALGFPTGHAPSERVTALARQTRKWFERNGRPWVFARRAGLLTLSKNHSEIEDVIFRSARLTKRFTKAEAVSAILAVVCAGREIEIEAQRCWQANRPDEYFFLEGFAVAVVEQLMAIVSARLCAEVESHGLSVLPHLSPGYAGWNLTDQVSLVRLMQRRDWPAGLDFDVLPSGQLTPKKSHVALFGLALKSDRLRCLTEMIPCEDCCWHPCSFRRTPYRHGGVSALGTLATETA